MACAFVSIGSNIDRANNIASALDRLRDHYGVLRVSSIYESRAVGFAGDNFYNLVVSFNTDETPRDVHNHLRTIEDEQGRVRGSDAFAARTLDLDLLLYDDLIVSADGLSLPREDIAHYAFVLEPLAEIAGNLRHPVTGMRLKDMWRQLDRKDVHQWRVD